MVWRTEMCLTAEVRNTAWHKGHGISDLPPYLHVSAKLGRTQLLTDCTSLRGRHVSLSARQEVLHLELKGHWNPSDQALHSRTSVLPQTSSPAFWHSYHRREDDGWSETWTWSNMVLPLVWNQPVTLSIGISVHQWWCRKRLRVETENRHVYKQSPQIPKQIYIKNARDGKPKCLLAFLIINDHPVKSISKLLGNVDIYA